LFSFDDALSESSQYGVMIQYIHPNAQKVLADALWQGTKYQSGMIKPAFSLRYQRSYCGHLELFICSLFCPTLSFL
jgi:hypothetical protein